MHQATQCRKDTQCWELREDESVKGKDYYLYDQKPHFAFSFTWFGCLGKTCTHNFYVVIDWFNIRYFSTIVQLSKLYCSDAVHW